MHCTAGQSNALRCRRFARTGCAPQRWPTRSTVQTRRARWPGSAQPRKHGWLVEGPARWGPCSPPSGRWASSPMACHSRCSAGAARPTLCSALASPGRCAPGGPVRVAHACGSVHAWLAALQNLTPARHQPAGVQHGQAHACAGGPAGADGGSSPPLSSRPRPAAPLPLRSPAHPPATTSPPPLPARPTPPPAATPRHHGAGLQGRPHLGRHARRRDRRVPPRAPAGRVPRPHRRCTAAAPPGRPPPLPGRRRPAAGVAGG